jgi:hypothetical protein
MDNGDARGGNREGLTPIISYGTGHSRTSMGRDTREGGAGYTQLVTSEVNRDPPTNLKISPMP